MRTTVRPLRTGTSALQGDQWLLAGLLLLADINYPLSSAGFVGGLPFNSFYEGRSWSQAQALSVSFAGSANLSRF